MAVLIQTLSAKLGIATGRNLPEIVEKTSQNLFPSAYGYKVNLVIMATDLAEFIGAALGLYLLFGIPMLPAALITAAGSFIILEFQRRGFPSIRAIRTGMIFIIVIAFGVQVLYAKPELSPCFQDYLFQNSRCRRYITCSRNFRGVQFAARNLFTFRLTQRRVVGTNDEQKRKIFRFEFIDIIIAMVIAGAINASMLIVAAALFFTYGCMSKILMLLLTSSVL